MAGWTIPFFREVILVMAWDADWENIESVRVRGLEPYLNDLEYALHERWSVDNDGPGGLQSLLISHDGFEVLSTYLGEFRQLFRQLLTQFMKPNTPYIPLLSLETIYTGHTNYSEQELANATGHSDILPVFPAHLTNQGIKDLLLQRKNIFDLMIRREYPGPFNYIGGGTNCQRIRIAPSEGPDLDIASLEEGVRPTLKSKTWSSGTGSNGKKEGFSCENSIQFTPNWTSYPGIPSPASYSLGFFVQVRTWNVPDGGEALPGQEQNLPTVFQSVSVSGSPVQVDSITLGGGVIEWAGLPEPGPLLQEFFVESHSARKGTTWKEPTILINFDVPGGFVKSLNAGPTP